MDESSTRESREVPSVTILMTLNEARDSRRRPRRSTYETRTGGRPPVVVDITGQVNLGSAQFDTGIFAQTYHRKSMV